MTQKRFKKLIMSKGYGRNAANEIVKETIQSGKPYTEAYMNFILINSIDLTRASVAFSEALKQISKVVTAAAKAIGAFIETFTQSMKRGRGND